MNYMRISGLILFTSMVAAGAQAAERNWDISGQSLRISTPCAKQVTIEPAADLQGKVEVRANASRQEEIDRLTVNGGAVATIDKNATCGNGWMSAKPSLVLTIRVATGMPLRIEEGGVADYDIGAVGGPLDLALTGSGNAHAINAAPLKVALTGSGDLKIGEVSGKIEGKASGSGNLSIGKANGQGADLVGSGSGDISIGGGAIGPVNAILRGSGNLTLPATGSLELLMTGSGNATFQQVSGAIEAQSSGSGNLLIDRVEANAVTMHISGSSDIKIGNGSIATLMLQASGSRDIVIDAAVGDATIATSGSSSVRIPKVSGKVVQNISGSGRLTIGH